MEKKNEYEGFRFSDLCVVIKVSANSMDDIKEIVKQTSEIQKEYSCNCTLNVVPFNEIQIDAKELARQYHQALSNNRDRRDRLKDLQV